MARHHLTRLGGLLVTAALVVSAGAAYAAPEEALMPLEKYTNPKGKSLASTYRTRLLEFSEQVYNCLPWLWMYPGRLGFPQPKGDATEEPYLSTWIFIDQRDDPAFTKLPQERRVSAMFSRYGVDMLRRMVAMPDVASDADITGLSVVLSWLKPGTGRPGDKAVNETFALFVDKATALDFLAKRVAPEEFARRAKFTLFDGTDSVGRVPLEVWEDTFNSTYKVANYDPPKGARCQ